MPGPVPFLERRAVRAAALVAVLGVAAAVRLVTFGWVQGGEEVRIVADGDVLYHLVQAQRLFTEGLQAVWRDPGLNHPFGADVPWPPLFDALLAGAGWLVDGGATPDRAALVAGAVWVPLVLGVLTVALLAWLGRALLGGRPWLDAALLLALLPSHAMMTVLGRADQHALEPLLLGLMVLAAARLARDLPPRGPLLLLAVASALAFWNWNGSALYLALLGGFAAALHALSAPGDEAAGRTAARLSLGLAGGALLLALSVALLGPPSAVRTAGLSGLTGLQPALVAGAALTCGALAAARTLRPRAGAAERVGAALLALLLPAAALLLLPWTREGISRGLTMLAARGWYRTIMEFRPLLPSGYATPGEDLGNVLRSHGLTPLLVLAALPLAWRRFRRGPADERGPVLLFGVLAVGALVIGWSRNRFAVYLSLAEALSAALVAREVAALVAARWTTARLAWLGRAVAAGVGPAARLLVLALAIGPVLPGLPGAAWVPITEPRYTTLAPLARLAGALTTAPGRDGVLVPWSHGHDLRWFSGRPVVSSPFGIEGGPGALQVDATFHRLTDQAEAEALLAVRRVGLVVTYEPLDEVISLLAFAPSGAREVVRPGPDPTRLDQARVLPAFNTLVVTRLWLWDGQYGDLDGRLTEGPPALDAFRLVGESMQRSIWMKVATPMFKLFEPVDGARVTVRGARPGQRVRAVTALRTNTGRAEDWSTWATADEAGVARLRLPYATGPNGAVTASAWRLDDGRTNLALEVSEQAIRSGLPLEARLGR